jgi:hypothetical protein
MIKSYPNLLTTAEIELIRDQFLSSNPLPEGMGEYVLNSTGIGDLSTTLDVVSKIEPLIIADYGQFGTLVFQNTYTRRYNNGGMLACHTDRAGLDVTLTVCIAAPENLNWPLCISTEKVDVGFAWQPSTVSSPYTQRFWTLNTAPGDGGACLGTRSPHWRNPLFCSDDRFVIQTFYHWTINN